MIHYHGTPLTPRAQLLTMAGEHFCVSYMIAIASSAAFTAAALADWATFTKLRGSWLYRANGSNVVGAAVDSLIFPTIAFGALMPGIVVAQFLAKVAGGALWAFVFSRRLGLRKDRP